MGQWKSQGSWNVCLVPESSTPRPPKSTLFKYCLVFVLHRFTIFLFSNGFSVYAGNQWRACSGLVVKTLLAPFKGYLPCPLWKTMSPMATYPNTVPETLKNTKCQQWRISWIWKQWHFFRYMPCFHQEPFSIVA